MKKTNLILLHGALGCQTQFAPLKRLLSDHFNVLTLNFEGHGERPSTNPFSIDLFAKNILDFLQENDISKTHIFGYSMGGYVSLRLTMLNPDIADRIITLGTKFNWTRESAAQEIKKLDPDKVEEKVPAFAKHLEVLHSGNNWKEVMRKTAKMMIDLGNGKKMKDENLKAITNEVLIGRGSLDQMVTLEESEHAANMIPRGKLMVIDGFKHPIEKVDMDNLAKIIERYLLNKSSINS